MGVCQWCLRQCAGRYSSMEVPALAGGPIAQIEDGDIITLDAVFGQLSVAADLSQRPLKTDFVLDNSGFGRPLLAGMRAQAGDAEQAAGLPCSAI